MNNQGGHQRKAFWAKVEHRGLKTCRLVKTAWLGVGIVGVGELWDGNASHRHGKQSYGMEFGLHARQVGQPRP